MISPKSIQTALQLNLPGEKAQLEMVPWPVDLPPASIPNAPENIRKSAVLLLLSENTSTSELQFTLTLRSSRLPSHSGQLSLPGGRIESGESIEQAALRETWEEIGVPETMPQVLGSLSALHVPHSRNLIHPVVAFVQNLPELLLCEDEVDEVFHRHVTSLMDTSILRRETWTLRGTQYDVPFWDVHDVPLWGATAMILSEFRAVVRSIERNG
ncbi:MAG: CoA pyrophosphatase [Balneolales bacterium]|nr:CoA pyrophosphatase [Balneolales bacterium]